MLEKARDKNCYDELLNCDLVAGLKKYFGQLDLAIAADVFIYVGDLSDVFDACFRALKPGGKLLFSVETTTSPKGLVLHPSGRFQHGLAYLEKQLEDPPVSLLYCYWRTNRFAPLIAMPEMHCWPPIPSSLQPPP